VKQEKPSLPSFLDYRPTPLLKRPAHIPAKARFPAVDAHNHIFEDLPARDLVAVMDQVGVQTFVNLSGNCTIPSNADGYTIRRRGLEVFLERYARPFPGRFAAFTMADFAIWGDFTLDLDGGFAEKCADCLEQDVRRGARGLKIMKELGLRYRDPAGEIVRIDDPRLYPVWKRAGELGVPVLIHSTDPAAFFLPVDEKNEHYPTLLRYPGWSFHGSRWSKQELLDQRTRVIADHPGTVFIGAHVANNPEDLAWVAGLLDRLPNLAVDFSARVDELGRQPYSAHDFFVKYQDRILFGADMPASPAMYRCYFRFLETRDEHFEYPGYAGESDYWTRWKICGLGLPDGVLEKVYRGNALRLIPGLG
jgi:predicted TIM-barrel fold metal-dependent hydrolase